MPSYLSLMWALKGVWALFIFAYGACIGSLINVIVYRMPLGISIVTPASRCPKCSTKLSWRDNIPVLGWIALGGKCRYCKSRISPEYPIVEAAVGLLFVLFYVVWYVLPPDAAMWGVHWGQMKPEWAHNDALQTWPEFVIVLLLMGSLVAMTLVDAKTFTIPLPLTWVPAIVGLGHAAHAAYLKWPLVKFMTRTPGEAWAIPTPGTVMPGGVLFTDWRWIGVALGGLVGLGISNLLVSVGLIRRSFADYAEWEARHLAEKKLEVQTPAGAVDLSPAVPDAAVNSGEIPLAAEAPANAEAVLTTSDGEPADLWIQYPHARREMVKELAFLGPVLGLAMVGWYALGSYGGVTVDSMTGALSAARVAPLWLTVLAGVVLGYLIGGGVVWAVRILGSAAFGKEAMGLGDVHLMAGVGACLGWIDATLAFFGAAFVGIAWAVVSAIGPKGVKRAMPYGPFLAIATVLVVLGRPLIEMGLTAMMHRPVRIP